MVYSKFHGKPDEKDVYSLRLWEALACFIVTLAGSSLLALRKRWPPSKPNDFLAFSGRLVLQPLATHLSFPKIDIVIILHIFMTASD